MKQEMARAIARLDSADGRTASTYYGRSSPTVEDIAAEKRAIYRAAQAPGSIAYIEQPSADEPEAAVVLMVAGDGHLLRVALGRNRTANLIQELVKALV